MKSTRTKFAVRCAAPHPRVKRGHGDGTLSGLGTMPSAHHSAHSSRGRCDRQAYTHVLDLWFASAGFIDSRMFFLLTCLLRVWLSSCSVGCTGNLCVCAHYGQIIHQNIPQPLNISAWKMPTLMFGSAICISWFYYCALVSVCFLFPLLSALCSSMSILMKAFVNTGEIRLELVLHCCKEYSRQPWVTCRHLECTAAVVYLSFLWFL